MDQTFRIHRGYRSTAWTVSSIATVITAVSAFDAPANRQWIALLVVGGVSLFWACASIALLLAYRRESLRVTDTRLVNNGVFGTQSIEFQDVVELEWQVRTDGGGILLRSPKNQVAIVLAKYDPSERLALIRYFHKRIPA